MLIRAQPAHSSRRIRWAGTHSNFRILTQQVLRMMDDTARLNHLDREQESQDGDSSVTERLDRWLAMVIQRGASDLLLVSGAPPCMRINGEVRKIEPGLLDGRAIRAAGESC